jgi:tetratricopeptide (TPR) repeat protein
MLNRFSTFCTLFGLTLLLFVEWSCQSDARTTTRIPPVPSKALKSEWQSDALQALTNLIRRRVDLDDSYYKRARIYFDQEKYSLAEADINQAISIQENVGEYYLLRGKINRELNKLDLALQDAQRADGLQQDSPALYILLADILQQKKQFNEASRYLSTALQIAPYEGNAYYVKGMLQASMADTTGSITSLRHSLALNPRMLRPYKQLTVLYTRTGDIQNALLYNGLALKRYPDDPELHLERGDIYQRVAKYDSAILSYQKTIQLDPTLSEVHIQLADIYMKWKNYAAALKSYENLAKYRSNYPHINYLIGFCYEKIGNDEKANEYYSKELQLNPNDQLATNGLWRLQSQKVNQYIPTEVITPNKIPRPIQPPRIFDTTRIKVNTIQPRNTLRIGSDSTRKIIIK